MTQYEQLQREAFLAWCDVPPGIIARQFDRVSSPVTRAVQNWLPEELIREGLNKALSVSTSLTLPNRLMKKAGVEQIEDLNNAPLEHCDKLARNVRRSAIMMAGGSGAATGIAGAAGWAIDIPALLTLALNSIQRTGMCYGISPKTDQERAFAIGIFALASANNHEEKKQALRGLFLATEGQADEAARNSLERAAERELCKETATVSMQALAQRIGVNLGQRKSASALPVMAAAIGGGINAWYMRDVTIAARHAFVARWLLAQADADFHNAAAAAINAPDESESVNS